jgi:hypothetical protein
MVRNPLEIIPSIISIAHEMWRFTIDIEERSPFQNQVYEIAKLFYDDPLARLEHVPPDSYVLLNYRDPVREPSRAIQRIHQQIGLSAAPEFI